MQRADSSKEQNKNNNMRTDTRTEKALTNGIAKMDINDILNGEKSPETQCDSGCNKTYCGKNQRQRCDFPSLPAFVAMFGPHGHKGHHRHNSRSRHGRRFCRGPPPPPGFGPHGPAAMEGPGPVSMHGRTHTTHGPPHMQYGPQHMGMLGGCPPWMSGMPDNMGQYPQEFGQPGFAGPMSYHGPQDFQGFPFCGMRQGMGRGMKWRRWAREMALQGGCGNGMYNKSRKCHKKLSEDDKETKCSHEPNTDSNTSGSEDEKETRFSSDFQAFPGMCRGMGRGMMWRRWARKMASQGGCPEELCNISRQCHEKQSEDDKETKCCHEHNTESNSSGSEDETPQDNSVGEFEQSLGAPPMTHLMIMQMHHLRMAKHHRMMAQNFAKRNQCIMKQRCRTMRKCGVTQEHIKAWRQRVREWKKDNKPCCEDGNKQDQTTTEEDSDKEESMV